MNTQTGGTGETIQLQPDAPQSPEQFDVNIRPQQQEQQIINEAPSSEASNITEQPIPSQTGVPMGEQTTEPTEVPIEEPQLPTAGPLTEEQSIEQEKKSTGFDLLSMPEDVYKQPIKVSRNEIYDPLNEIVDRDYQSALTLRELNQPPIETPKVDLTGGSMLSGEKFLTGPLKEVRSLLNDMNENPTKPMSSMKTEDVYMEDPNLSDVDKQDAIKKVKTSRGNFEYEFTSGDRLSDDEIEEMGLDKRKENLGDAFSSEIELNADEKEQAKVDQEISILTDDERKTALQNFDAVVAEREKAKQDLEIAKQNQDKEAIKKLRGFLNSSSKRIKELQKDPVVAEREKLEKKASKGYAGWIYDANTNEFVRRGEQGKEVKSMKDYTLHPKNYKLVKPLSENSLKKLYPDKTDDEIRDIQFLFKNLFMRDGALQMKMNDYKKLSDQFGSIRNRDENDFIQDYTLAQISRLNLTVEDLAKLDNHLKGALDWKYANDKTRKDGFNDSEFKVVQLPNGYLPKIQYGGYTFFDNVQENKEQLNRNKSHYGSSGWSEKAGQYTETKLKPNAETLFIPSIVRKDLKFKIPGFSESTLNLQRTLALKKDENGEPFLKSNKGFFNKGLTGVLDSETKQAKAKYEQFQMQKQKKLQNEGIIKPGTFDYGIGETEDLTEDAESMKKNEIKKFADSGFKKTNAYYGKWALKNIPLKTFGSYSDAETWAKKNLPDNRKTVDVDWRDIDNMDQNQFADYINSLGLPVYVEKGGNALDWDNVTIYSSGGRAAKPFEVDLGENDYQTSNALSKGLTNWLNSVQVSPREKFLRDWSAVNAPDLFVASQTRVLNALGTQFAFTFRDRDGSIRRVFQDNEGADKSSTGINEVIGLIEDNNKRIESQYKSLDKKQQDYQLKVQPIVEEYNSSKKQAQSKLNELNKSLNALETKRQKEGMADDVFKQEYDNISQSINQVNQSLLAASDKYSKSVKSLGKEYEGLEENSELIGQLVTQAQLMSDDMAEAYNARVSFLSSVNEAPNTSVGRLFSYAIDGFMKPTQALASWALDIADASMDSKSLYGRELTDEERRIAKNEFKTEVIYGKLADAVLQGMDLYISPDAKERMPFWEQAVGGAVESVSSMFNPVNLVTRGALSAATSIPKYMNTMIAMIPHSYASIDKEIESNPELSTLPDWQKKSIAIPYTIFMGAIEGYGMEKVFAGSPSLTNRLLNSIVTNAAKDLPKDSSLKVLQQAIRGDIKYFVPRLLSAFNRGGIAELETELVQAGLLDVGLKETADALLGLDAFNKDYVMADYIKLLGENAIGGYIGGIAMGGPARIYEAIKTGDVKMINKEDYEMFRLTAADPDLKKVYTESIANAFVSRQITEEQAKEMVEQFESISKIENSIHPDVTNVEDRIAVSVLINEKNKLEEQAKNADPSQKKLFDEDINQIQASIDRYVNTALEKKQEQQKAQEQNDKENEQGIPSEVGEGQEPVQAEPVVEAGQEEVSPSGVVQEEQTQVTEEPGIEFAGIPIKEEGEPTAERTDITEPIDLFAQPTEETNIQEVEAAPSTPVQAVSDIADIKKVRGVKAKQEKITEYNAKYGEGQYERMSEIYANFTPIVKALEKNNLIKKDC